MERIARTDEIAEMLRGEPYHLLTNNCITKSFRLKRRCRAEGINARVVICVGKSPVKWFGRRVTAPVIHGWGDVDGTRIETSRPLGAPGVWGMVPVEIKPLIALRF